MVTCSLAQLQQIFNSLAQQPQGPSQSQQQLHAPTQATAPVLAVVPATSAAIPPRASGPSGVSGPSGPTGPVLAHNSSQGSATMSSASSISGIVRNPLNLSLQTASTSSNTNANTNTNASVGSTVYNSLFDNHTWGSFSFISNTKTSPTYSDNYNDINMDLFNATPNNSMSTLDPRLSLLFCFVLFCFCFCFVCC